MSGIGLISIPQCVHNFFFLTASNVDRIKLYIIYYYIIFTYKRHLSFKLKKMIEDNIKNRFVFKNSDSISIILLIRI